MKSLKVTNIGEMRNELNRYQQGRKLDMHQFNQVARLAWFGRLILQPLDPQDPDCRFFLACVQEPDELAAHYLDTDQELAGTMHIIAGEQTGLLIQVLRTGAEEWAKPYEDLSRSDFCFRCCHRPQGDPAGANRTGASQHGSEE